jgi:hypothetical protein
MKDEILSGRDLQLYLFPTPFLQALQALGAHTIIPAV